MFTGLIQEIGVLRAVRRTSAGLRWSIAAPSLAPCLKPGDSINISGACQTVEEIAQSLITGTAIPETLRVTHAARWTVGRALNLELALRADERLGGHLVSGHVDTTGRVSGTHKSAGGVRLDIAFDAEYDRWVVAKGSIALDGVSLTVAHCARGRVTVALIPETLAKTTLGRVRVGDTVNVEFDQMIKAVVKGARSRGVDEALLERVGF